METTTINQIIESVTLFITAISTIGLVYFLSIKLLKCKHNITREITLLKDLIFYRTVVELYKNKMDEHEVSNQYKNFRTEAKKLTGIEPSRTSEPKQIENRLKYLNELNDKIEKTISKIDKKI